jgi:uncharacterized Zn-binding protein involved in type VI secretion
MATVSINPPKTPVTKGSSSIAAATLPNVCKMPGPPAPFVPTPLPNIGNSGNSPQGYSKSVDVEGQPVAIAGSSFGSTGDVASQATGGGLLSSNTQGPTKFIGPGSFNVQIEGKNVQLLGDPMLNNCGPSGSPANAGTMTGVIHASGEMTVIYGDDKPCGRCGKTHPLEAGPETLKMMRTLMKALRRKFDEQKERIKELNEINRRIGEEQSRWAKMVAKQKRGQFSISDIGELEEIERDLRMLSTRSAVLESFFESEAILRWDPGTKTYSSGYMLGVMVCICVGKKQSGGKYLGACSGRAPPAFARIVVSAGFECASAPVVVGASSGGRACAAKQIMAKIAGHRPFQLIERWFFPVIAGIKFHKGPLITFEALVEDAKTGSLRVESRSQRFGSGENVPSCDGCQKELPEMYCDTHC